MADTMTDEQQAANGVVEGTAEEIDRAPAALAVTPRLAVTPQVTATELVDRLDMIREAQEKAMVLDVDYGKVPGTDKPTLFKPGSEKLSVLFQLDVQPVQTKTWGPGDHLTVESVATVFHAPTGTRIGRGEGLCTTRERKYAYRNQQRKCPVCNVEAVIKGKPEYGGGWLCFWKKGGCGARWPDGAKEVEDQEVGEIDNPDLPDLWNTVVKMAEKRARVDAVLAVTGASALFTQDVEDTPHPPQSAQAVDQPAPDTITASEAKALVGRIREAGIPSDALGLQLVVFGVEHDGIGTTKKAQAALQRMTVDQAFALDRWIVISAEKLKAEAEQQEPSANGEEG